jgi:hypothetical protein
MRGVIFAPSDSHHVRRHLEKSRREKSCAAKSMVKMRGVFFAPSDFRIENDGPVPRTIFGELFPHLGTQAKNRW